jgi:hypothetical protein
MYQFISDLHVRYYCLPSIAILVCFGG